MAVAMRRTLITSCYLESLKVVNERWARLTAAEHEDDESAAH